MEREGEIDAEMPLLAPPGPRPGESDADYRHRLYPNESESGEDFSLIDRCLAMTPTERFLANEAAIPYVEEVLRAGAWLRAGLPSSPRP